MDATATGSDELAIAMSKVAGTTSVAQISLEKMSSWLSLISSKTRESAETVGFSMQSILSRYMSIKEKGFNEEDATKINDVTKALSSIGIQATDSQGQLKNFTEIMDSLGDKFNSLTTNQKAYITTTLAGTRQGSRLSTLLQNYSESMDLYNESLNATGITQQKFNIYQESMQAHLDKLANTQQNIFKKVFNSDDLIQAIDLIDSLALGVDKVLDRFGFLPTAVGLTTGAISAFKKELSLIQMTNGDMGLEFTGRLPKMFENLKQSVSGFSKEWDRLNTQSMYVNGTFAQIPSTLTRASNGFKALKTSVLSSATAFSALNVAMNIGIGLAIGFAVQGIMKLADNLIHAKEKAQELNQELTQSVQDSAKSITEVSSLLAKAESLESQIGKSKSTEEQTKLKAELLEIQKQIAQAMGSTISGFDSEGNAIAANNALTKEQIELKKQEMLLKAQEFMDKNDTEDVETKIQKYKTLQEEVKKLKLAQAQGKDKITETYTKFDDMTGQEEEYTRTIKVNEALQDKNKEMQDILKVVQQYNVHASTLNKFDDQQVKTLSIQTEEIKKNTKAKEENANVQGGENNAEVTAKEYEALTESFLKAREALAELNKAQAEYAENGSYSESTISSLIEKYPNLIMYLNDEKALHGELSKMVDERKTATENAYQSMMMKSQQYYQTEVGGMNGVMSVLQKHIGDRANAYKTDLANAKSVAEAKVKVETRAVALVAEAWAKFYNMVGTSYDAVETGDIENYDVMGERAQSAKNFSNAMRTQNSRVMDAFKKANQLQSELNGIRAGFDDIQANISMPNFGSVGVGSKGSSSGSKGSKSEPKTFEGDKAFDTDSRLKTAIRDIETLDKSIEKLTDTTKAFRDKGDFENALKSQTELIAEMEKKLKSLGIGITNTTNIKDGIKKQILSNFGSAFAGQDLDKMVEGQFDIIHDKLFNKTVTGLTDAQKKKLEDSSNLFKELTNSWFSAKNQIEELNDEIVTSTSDMLNAVKEKAEMNREMFDFVGSMENDIVDALRNQYEKELELAKDSAAEKMLVLRNFTKEQEKLIKDGSATREELFEKEHEAIIDGLNEELDKYQEIYNAKIKEIDRTEETDDYEKELNKKQEEKLKLQAQYNTLLLDSSASSRIQREELALQIAEKEEEIQEFTHDRTIDLRKQNLQDELDKNQKAIQDKIEKENEAYNVAKARYDQEVRALEFANQQKLQSETLYAEARTMLMQGNLTTLTELLTKYGSDSEKIFSSMGDIIKDEIINRLEDAVDLMKQLSQAKVSALSSIGTNKVASFATGGIPSNEGLAFVNAKERILPTHLTKSFDDLVYKVLPKVGIPSLNLPSAIGKSIELKIDKLINIDGDVNDKNVVSKIQNAGNDVMNTLVKKLNQKGVLV